MAGPAVDVEVTSEAVASEPTAPELTTPESAVRSYLDWVSYAYRLGQSRLAVPTMSSYQEVRVDSYVQYNLQQQRLLDQTLVSITFETPEVTQGQAILRAKEHWRYSYVSATNAGEVISGPFEVDYDATYTLVTNEQGGWIVDSVQATAGDKVE